MILSLQLQCVDQPKQSGQQFANRDDLDSAMAWVSGKAIAESKACHRMKPFLTN